MIFQKFSLLIRGKVGLYLGLNPGRRSVTSSAMLLILEVFVVFWKVFWCCVKAVFQLIVPPSKKDIEGQIVLVTGAGGVIGRQLSLEFAEHGARLVLWDINKETNEETAALVRSLGKVAHTYQCDCSNRDDIYRVAERVKCEVGDVDILVNNAGILNGRRLMNLKDIDIERTIKINTLAHFWTVRAFLPGMLSRNQGHIVNIVSIAGSCAAPNLTDYCASKFGAVGFNNALLLELLEDGRATIHSKHRTCVASEGEVSVAASCSRARLCSEAGSGRNVERSTLGLRSAKSLRASLERLHSTFGSPNCYWQVLAHWSGRTHSHR